MKKRPLLTRKDILAFFHKSQTIDEKVGIEVELAIVDSKTGISIPYEGDKGVRALLEALIMKEGWSPIIEENKLFGLKRPDGTKITLEPGGAIEYSSAPTTSLVALVNTMREVVLNIADIAQEIGVVLLATGNFPFDKLGDIKWIPKSRVKVARDYLADFGAFDKLAWRTMAQTLSVQVNFDYVSENDMRRKMQALVGAAPVVTALFANSPIEAGTLTNKLSCRSEYWLRYYSKHCGLVSPAFTEGMTFDHYIDWLLSVPMFFRVKNRVYKATKEQSFSEVLDRGFDDGTQPTFADWLTHLSVIYTDIRLRNVIEIRSVDGQAFQNIPCVPAFLTGIVYHQPSVETLQKLFKEYTLEEYQAVRSEVCIKGLKAKYGKDSVREIALEMVRLAKEGLQARVKAGLEHPKVLSYLDPIEEVAASGLTFAERSINRWKADLQYSPANFVEAYRVK